MPRRAVEQVNELLRDEDKALILFPITVLFTAPVMHELFHVIFLKLYRCPYNAGLSFSITEILIQLDPACQLTVPGSLLVLGAGILGNALVAITLFYLAAGLRLRARTEAQYLDAFYLSVISLGFLFSISFYFFFSRGDIVNMLAVLDLSVAPVWRYVTGMVIMVFTIVRFWLGFEAAEHEYHEDLLLEEAQHRTAGVRHAFRRHLEDWHDIQIGGDEVEDEQGED